MGILEPILMKPLLRAAGSLWISCHLMVGVLLFLVGGTLWPRPVTSVTIVLLVPILFDANLRVWRASLFLENLGVSRTRLLLGVLLLAAGLEVFAGTVVSLMLGAPPL